MADANYSSIGIIKETSWGVTPNTPRLKALRITGEDLKHEKETIQSQEVRDDRQVADLVEVGVQASGGVEFELSYGSFTDLIAAALFNAPVAINVAAVTADIVAGGTQTMTGAAGDFDHVPVGATVKVAGLTATADNGLKLVVAKSNDGSALTFAPNSFSIGETDAEVTLTGSHLRNGTTRSSFTLERRVKTAAGTDFFQTFLGQVVDALTLNFESKAIVTGGFTFLGRFGDASNDSVDAAVAASGYDPATTTPVMNATNNIGTFLFDKTASAEALKSLTLNIANGLRGKDAMGTKGNFDIGVGTFELTGNLSAYFQSNALYEKYLDHSDVALSWRVTDALGNTIVFTIPRMKLGTGEPKIEGRNTDVMVASDWTAILDPVTGATFIVDFHPAA